MTNVLDKIFKFLDRAKRSKEEHDQVVESKRAHEKCVCGHERWQHFSTWGNSMCLKYCCPCTRFIKDMELRKK